MLWPFVEMALAVMAQSSCGDYVSVRNMRGNVKSIRISALLVVLLAVIPCAKAGFFEFNDCVIAASRSSPWPFVSDGAWRAMCARLSPFWSASCFRYGAAGMTEKINFCYNLLYDVRSFRIPRAAKIETLPSGSVPYSMSPGISGFQHQESWDEE